MDGYITLDRAGYIGSYLLRVALGVMGLTLGPK